MIGGDMSKSVGNFAMGTATIGSLPYEICRKKLYDFAWEKGSGTEFDKHCGWLR